MGMAALEIRLFGVGRIRHRSAADSDALSPSVSALLGYLVLNRHRPHHRDLLAGTFWGDIDEASARNRLSTALWRLRSVLEPDGVASGLYLRATRRGEVAFNDSSDYWLDVAVFERAAQRLVDTDQPPSVEALVAYEQAAVVFGNELLEGADQPWLVIERERLTQLYLAATARCMDGFTRLGDLDRAIAAGQRILDREPLREDTHRALIRLYCDSGQRARASQQFERVRQLLHDELRVVPLPETLAAAASIHHRSPAGRPPVQIEDALMLIDSASQSLGIALSELDALARSLRQSTART